MRRRNFVQLSAWSAIGIPFGFSSAFPALVAEDWQSWLQTVVKKCRVEKLGRWSQEKSEIVALGNVFLQRKDMEGFIPAPTAGYFVYEQEQQQYVFSGFTKHHPVAGLLEVALAFWVKKGNNWEYLTTLSQFQLEAMAHACQVNVLQVLPVLRGYSLQHRTDVIPIQAGWMEIKTILNNHHTQTTITLYQDKKRVWQEDFASKYPLCSHEIV